MAEEFLYNAECNVLRSIALDVRNTLGSGWHEEAYHQGMVRSLQDANIPVVSKPRKALLHNGAEIHLFEPDIIVWDKIALELKTQHYVTGLLPSHYAQVIPYLKCFKLKLGLLMNFGPPRFWMKRIIRDQESWERDENYLYWEILISDVDRAILKQVRTVIFRIAN